MISKDFSFVNYSYIIYNDGDVFLYHGMAVENIFERIYTNTKCGMIHKNARAHNYLSFN